MNRGDVDKIIRSDNRRQQCLKLPCWHNLQAILAEGMLPVTRQIEPRQNINQGVLCMVAVFRQVLLAIMQNIVSVNRPYFPVSSGNNGIIRVNVV